VHDRVAVQVLPFENALEFGPHLLLRHVAIDHLAADDLDHVQAVFDRSGRGHGESSHRLDAPDIAIRRHGADLAHHRDGRTVGVGAFAEWGVLGGHRRDAGRARVFWGRNARRLHKKRAPRGHPLMELHSSVFRDQILWCLVMRDLLVVVLRPARLRTDIKEARSSAQCQWLLTQSQIGGVERTLESRRTFPHCWRSSFDTTPAAVVVVG
jgi:hypothetical protein